MNNHRVLIIGADGMRPDIISSYPDLLPNFHRLLRKGAFFPACAASYPTATRVNISTLTTGVYPGKHGLVNNIMYMPGFSDKDRLQTGDGHQIMEYSRKYGQPLLRRPTLGDRLAKHGKRLGVATSSTLGAALLWNINHPQDVINADSDYGLANLKEIHQELGGIGPEAAGTYRKKAHWATRALIDCHLNDSSCQAMVLWLSEPDKTFHSYAAGAPEMKDTLLTLDDCLGEVLAAIDRNGLRESLNLLLISDHGHISHESGNAEKNYLAQAIEELRISHPLVVMGYNIYNPGGTPMPRKEAESLAGWLYQQSWCDTVFCSRSDLTDISGVLPLNLLYQPGEDDDMGRLPLFAINPIWSHEDNKFGVPGVLKTPAPSPKPSGHGTLSAYELRPFCLGYGPVFLEGAVSPLPCGLVDIAPTVCHLAGMENETGFDGRILAEGLKHSPAIEPVPQIEHKIYRPIREGAESENRSRGVWISKLGSQFYIRGTDCCPVSLRKAEKNEYSGTTVIAHRGASSYAPENTIAAFDIALNMGIRDVELDVHLSLAHEVIVLHDDKVDRTTDGSGEAADFTFAQLQELDAGKWFSESYTGERIPSLRSILSRYAGRLRLHIELKGYRAGLVPQTLDLIYQHGIEDSVVLTSFKFDALKEAAEAAPEIRRGWLVRKFSKSLMAEAEPLGLSQICPSAAHVDADLVDYWHRAGYEVRAFGVKDEALMQKALEAGVDGMTVNFPDRLRSIVEPDPFIPKE